MELAATSDAAPHQTFSMRPLPADRHLHALGNDGEHESTDTTPQPRGRALPPHAREELAHAFARILTRLYPGKSWRPTDTPRDLDEKERDR
jgi:hypothetical protein